MDNDGRIVVTIGRTKISVPVYGDAAATREIADEVSKRLAAIEESSPRIDSVAFAVQAAFEMAIEADLERRARTADREEFEQALKRIAGALQDVVARRTAQPHQAPKRRD